MQDSIETGTAEPVSTRRYRWLMLLILALLGVAANEVSLSLAFGIDFIFGSVFALLALRLLGLPQAILVAAVAASYTYVLWGHAYAWVNFTLEIACVGMLLRSKRIQSLVVADTLYWLLIGIPLVWLGYAVMLHLPAEQVWLIALKQPVNAVTNAILASLILLVVPGEWIGGKGDKQEKIRIGIREMAFTLIIAIVYASSITILLVQGRSIHQALENEVETELQDHADEIMLYINHSGASYSIEHLIQIFIPQNEDDHHGIILLSREGKLIASTHDQVQTEQILADSRNHNKDQGLYIWHPERKSMPLMLWWNHSIYYVSKRIDSNGIGRLIITNPTRDTINRIHQYNIEGLGLLIIVMLVAMMVAALISRVFSHTILRLVDITDNLPNKLRKGTEVEWPNSRILELDKLSKQSSIMSQEILKTFKGYEDSQEELNEQVRFTSAALDENYARSSAIIAGSVEGIITTDERGRIETFNTAAEEMFGYSSGQVIGTDIFMLLAEPYRTKNREYLAAYLTGAEARVVSKRTEMIGQRSDGTEFPLELSLSEIRLQDRRIFTGIISDISERKEMERLKNEFVSTVSHELRTPLTAIRGAIGLLSAKESTGLSEKSRQLLNITLNNTQRLVRLINDILDIQKLEAGSMRFPLSHEKLRPIVETVVEQNRSYVEQFEIHLGMEFPDEDIFILTNVDRLNQVLTNLISNAAKFSPSGSQIKLIVVREDGHVRIEVQDQGRGIPKEFQEHIFEKFSQADGSSTRKQGGTGLGLSISKGFVEQMGGSIDFRTSPEQGTVFFVIFPISRAA